MSSVTREEIIGLLKVAACPASCDNGVVVRDQLHGEIEQCQFCFEREQAIAALQAAEPEGHKEAIGLVEVLESIIAHYPHPDIDHERFRVLACRFAEQALSEYRQQEEVER